MSAVQQFLLTGKKDREEGLKIAQETANSLQSKQVTLVEVVESLGEYISGDDDTNRARAVDYLALVVGELPPGFLSRQQLEVLCQFLCDRISDGGSIGGLRKLQAMDRFNGDLAILTTRAVISNAEILRGRLQPQRMQVLELLSALMANYRKALKSLGNDAVVGITDVVAGEKDPRNLMVIFSILHALIVEWDISDHAELLFDSVFCYFPITFRPPPNDPFGVTAQDLKDRLKECIAASASFAPYAFPQLVDKLDSTSINVKRDVLQTITACALSYGPKTMSNYSITLWDSIKFEILNMQEESLAEEALLALGAISMCLSRDSGAADFRSSLANYLRPIVKEANQQLQEPQHKQAQSVGRILKSIGAASHAAFSVIVKSVLPPLSTLYQGADNISKKRALLEVLVQILDGAIIVYGSPSVPALEQGMENPLNDFKDRLFELSSQALMSTTVDEVSFRMVAIKVLLRLCQLRAFLQESEIGMVVQYLDEIVLAEDPMGRDDLRKEAIQALVEISRIKADLIMNITFPALMARLPDADPPNHHECLITLEALAQLSVDKFVADTLVRRLLTRLENVLAGSKSSAYPQALLATILYILARRELAADPNLQYYFEKIVIGLTTKTLEGVKDGGKSTVLNDPSTMEILARLITLIVKALDNHKRKSVAAQLYSLFDDGALFQPVVFRGDVSQAQQRTLILSTAVLAGIPSSANIEFIDPAEPASTRKLLERLGSIASTDIAPPVRQTVLRQIALIVNKFTPSTNLDLAYELLDQRISELTSSSQKSNESQVRIIFWLAKALILRLAPRTSAILTQLSELLSSSVHGTACARGFGLILAPDEILNKENGAQIRLLVNQKVFTSCIPTLSQKVRTNSNASAGTNKANYLIALSGILRYIPTEVLMQEIDTLLPLLLQSLDMGAGAGAQAATIHTLTAISLESPAALTWHITSLITRLLRTASAKDVSAADESTRLLALRCLRTFPGRVSQSALLPLKEPVVRSLMLALDDPRRGVRREAVDCRAVWLGLDEPDSD